MIQKLLKGYLVFSIFIFPFALRYMVFDGLPKGWEFAAWIMLFLYASYIFLWRLQVENPWQTLSLFILISVFTFVLEYWGAHYGILFGEYSYTDALGPKIMGVPLTIPLAWYAVALSSFGILFFQTRNTAKLVLGTALLVLALDIVLEPYAAFINKYWLWDGKTVPLRNYLSWFVIALLIAVLLKSTRFKANPKWTVIPYLVFFMQWLLFALVDLKEGFYAPVFVSFFMIAFTLTLFREFK